MAPGNFNGKNYGGLHTGTGKYQNGGPYANNGYRRKMISHREFTEGKRVAYIGTHKDFRESRGTGVVISKKTDSHKTPRTIIKVKLDDGRHTYFNKHSLLFM
jgi:hypothetical protein